MSVTLPVTAIGPRWRCSIGASCSIAVSRIKAKPAAKTVNASAASHHTRYRRNAITEPIPAITAAMPGHKGGSTFRRK
jgi:hypothetical protein